MRSTASIQDISRISLLQTKTRRPELRGVWQLVREQLLAKGRSRAATRVFWVQVQWEHSLGKRVYLLSTGRLPGDCGRWEKPVPVDGSPYVGTEGNYHRWACDTMTQKCWALQGSMKNAPRTNAYVMASLCQLLIWMILLREESIYTPSMAG